jgi:hypothetical protein
MVKFIKCTKPYSRRYEVLVHPGHKYVRGVYSFTLLQCVLTCKYIIKLKVGTAVRVTNKI